MPGQRTRVTGCSSRIGWFIRRRGHEVRTVGPIRVLSGSTLGSGMPEPQGTGSAGVRLRKPVPVHDIRTGNLCRCDSPPADHHLGATPDSATPYGLAFGSRCSAGENLGGTAEARLLVQNELAVSYWVPLLRFGSRNRLAVMAPLVCSIQHVVVRRFPFA